MNRIDIEDVIRIEKERRAINKFEADEVSLFYKGRRIDLPKEHVDDWKYTGLSLISFIEMIVIPEYTDHEL